MSVSALPRWRSGVIFCRVGSEGVLFNPADARTHRLNATAVLVWECCDGTASTEAISDELADAFGQSAASILGEVQSVVRRFAESGLLDARDEPNLVRGDEQPMAADLEARPTTDALRRLGPYAALGARVMIDVHDSNAVADELERVLESIEVPAQDVRGADVVTLVAWGNGEGKWELDAAGRRVTAPDESMLADFVLWEITRLAVEHSPRHLVIHASAVARDGRAIVFPAAPNSGKSTLATMLVEAGFDYLTDEATAIDLATGEILPYPKPITLDPGTQRLLPHLDPHGLPGASTKWRIAPTMLRRDAVADRAMLAHIVLPHHEAGADNTLVAANTIDAVVQLLSASFNLSALGHPVDDVTALASRCSVHTLRHDGVEGPVAAIESLIGAVR